MFIIFSYIILIIMEQLSFSNEETSFFNYLFSLYSKSIPNYITGTEVYSLFLKSNLNKTILKRIWDLSSIRKQVNLTKFEFFFACRLISFSQKGENLNENTIKFYDKHMSLPVFEGILYENKNKHEKNGNLDDLFNYLSHNIEVITKHKIINEDGFNNIEKSNNQANQTSQTSKNNSSSMYNNEYNTNNKSDQYETSNNYPHPNQMNQNQSLSFNNIPPSNRKESIKEDDFEFEEVKEEGDVKFNDKEKEIVEKQIEKINNLDLFLSKMILEVKDKDDEKEKQKTDIKSEVDRYEHSSNINKTKDFEMDKEKSKKENFEVEDDFEFEEVVENKDEEKSKEKEEKLNEKEIKITKEEGNIIENVNIVIGNIDDFFGKMEEIFITKNDNNQNNDNKDNNEKNYENNDENNDNNEKNDVKDENEIKMDNDNEADFEFEEVEEKIVTSGGIINENKEIQIEAEKEKETITLNTNYSNTYDNNQSNEIKNESKTENEKQQAEDEFDFEEVDEKIEKDYTFDGLLKGFTMENPSLKEKQNERKVEINETDKKETPQLKLIESLMLKSKIDDKKLIKNTYSVLDELTKVLNSSIDYIISKVLPFYKKYSNENEEIVNSLEAITENRKINDFGKRISFLFELYSNNVSLLNMYKDYISNDKSQSSNIFNEKHDLYLNDYKSKLSKLTEINSIINTNLTSFSSIKLDSIEITNNKNNQYDDIDENGSFCGLCFQKILHNKAFLYGFDYHYICINFWINKIKVGSQNED